LLLPLRQIRQASKSKRSHLDPRTPRFGWRGQYGKGRPRRQVIYRVEFHEKHIPRQFYWISRRYTRGFETTNRVCWVRTRKIRDDLLSYDITATWSEHEVRGCTYCGGWLIGIEAQELGGPYDPTASNDAGGTPASELL